MSETRHQQRSGYRPTVTIRQMMISVAVVAALLPAMRREPDGERLAGALIVGICVWLMSEWHSDSPSCFP
jgi:hypothetical protein